MNLVAGGLSPDGEYCCSVAVKNSRAQFGRLMLDWFSRYGAEGRANGDGLQQLEISFLGFKIGEVK